ncbi:MAG: GIY-YIG nuclease family protein [Planctomycetes bacterium]|nr:GIY-YIG nuclease family protein [Planctomycetota bacterium]
MQGRDGKRIDLELLGHAFKFISYIDPARGDDGAILEFMPQARYRNARGLKLNVNGHGPFCRFVMRGAPPTSGVYSLALNGQVVYVGKCVSLARRFGPTGYGLISPKNCFEGGQSTNCKVNYLTLQATRSGSRVEVWFHETAAPEPIEAKLIEWLQPRWNVQHPRGKLKC